MKDPQLWISAIEIGCFFGLIALAYLLILVGSGFFNFAIGPYAMLGGLSTSWLVVEHEVPVPLAMLVGIVLVIIVSAVTELAVVRQVQKRAGKGELPALVAVSAVLFAVQQGSGLIFGQRPLPGQQIVPVTPINVGSAVVYPSTFILIGTTVVFFIATALWMRSSRMGRLLRAVGDNKEAAAVLGLPVSRARLTAFVLGGLIAAVAGILFSTKSGVAFTHGLGWTLTGFLALVIGGTGRIIGPLVGGLILGAIQVFVPFYLASLGPQAAIFLLGLVFFAFKPEGIFTRKVRA
ncbi:MAG: branched-chain amino acid ABC transporter permease [Tetrasphaera sp.]|nr:branched-chain amino acid ABC transporter permease [Tetrasphaera sp.]